jgi:vacuolar-type H+-ATPase subunit H
MPMAKQSAPDRSASDPAEQAMAAVLRAEREAREAVERTRIAAEQIAEAARASARAVTERTERRIRSVVGAFESELAQRLAGIEAQAASIARPQPLSADDVLALQRAVGALARELTAAPP